jgi:hypothetical protein
VLRDSMGTITGDLGKQVRAKMHNQGIKDYFMEKYKWEEMTWRRIDHDSVARSIKKLTPADKRKLN